MIKIIYGEPGSRFPVCVICLIVKNPLPKLDRGFVIDIADSRNRTCILRQTRSELPLCRGLQPACTLIRYQLAFPLGRHKSSILCLLYSLYSERKNTTSHYKYVVRLFFCCYCRFIFFYIGFQKINNISGF